MQDKYEHWLGRLFGWFNGSERYAVTFGQTTYYSMPQSDVSIRWRMHEDTHKLQYARDGWIKFLARYIWQLVTKGYSAIDYEIEARRAESGLP